MKKSSFNIIADLSV